MLSSGRGQSRIACMSARNQCVSPAETQRLSSATILSASVLREAVASARGLISLLDESGGAVAFFVLLASAAGTRVAAAGLAADCGRGGSRLSGAVAGLRGCGLPPGPAPVAGARGNGGTFGVIRRPALGRINCDRRGRLLLHRCEGDVEYAARDLLLNVLR